MEFECDFDGVNFCKYSSFGWGFQKSLEIAQKIIMEVGKNFVQSNQNNKKSNNLRQNFPSTNYFPCTDYNSGKEPSKLVKKIPKNISQPLCLKMAYLLEEKGQITITDHKSKWSINSTDKYNKWNYITFPVSIQNSDDLSKTDSRLEISGQSLCVDNFTVTNQPCSLTTTFYDNKFSSGQNLWLTQPFSVLLAIIAMMVLLVFLGVTLSILCAKQSQRTLQRSKQSSRRSKTMRIDRCSIPNSVNHNDLTLNSNFDIDTFASSRPLSANHTRCLPAVVHVRSNPQLLCYSRHHSFQATKSVDSNETNAHCRFSLALTEDAQLQLLTNSNCNGSSPPVSTDLSVRNAPIMRQQSFTTTISHERTPSPTEPTGSSQRPQSIIIVPSFCAPIIDQSESDLSMDSVPATQQQLPPQNRSRPIRESMNIGYVSDNSPCDLPHYDAALELLAAHKMKLAQSIMSNDQSDVANNNDTHEIHQFDSMEGLG